MMRAVLVAVLALCCLAVSAGAQTYAPTDSAQLSTALNSAAASAENDTIQLATGTVYAAPVGFQGFGYDGSTGGSVEIVGAGSSTVVQISSGVAFSSVGGGRLTLRSLRINGVSPGGGGVGVSAYEGADVALDRVEMRGVLTGVSSRLSATWSVRNSLIDLGGIAANVTDTPIGVSLANDSSFDHTVAALTNVTILGSGTGAVGIQLDSFRDYTPAPYPTIDLALKNSIIAMSGSGAHDLSCPNFSFDYSIESVNFDRVAADPSTFNLDDCGSLVGTFANTNSVNRSTMPLLLSADGVPTAGSSAIDAGDPAFVPAAGGELDLAGNSRVFGPAVDLGAYEFGSSPPVDGNDPATALTLKFGKLTGKLRVAKKAKTLRRGNKRSKPRMAVSLSAAAKVTFTLTPVKKKAKKLKGSVKLTMPAGTSYLTWTGKWGKKKLKPGRYKLTANAPGLAKAVTRTVKFSR